MMLLFRANGKMKDLDILQWYILSTTGQTIKINADGTLSVDGV